MSKEIKINKKEWRILETLEDIVNGYSLGGKEFEGIFDDEYVYEVNRGIVDKHLRLTKKKGYCVTIHNKDKFKLLGNTILNIVKKGEIK